MLVLSRKVGEQVVVAGGAVTITVVAVQGQRVRLGVTAPPAVAVLRDELDGGGKARHPAGGEPTTRA
jgi:carbon storage regulator